MIWLFDSIHDLSLLRQNESMDVHWECTRFSHPAVQVICGLWQYHLQHWALGSCADWTPLSGADILVLEPSCRQHRTALTASSSNVQADLCEFSLADEVLQQDYNQTVCKAGVALQLMGQGLTITRIWCG